MPYFTQNGSTSTLFNLYTDDGINYIDTGYDIDDSSPIPYEVIMNFALISGPEPEV